MFPRSLNPGPQSETRGSASRVPSGEPPAAELARLVHLDGTETLQLGDIESLAYPVEEINVTKVRGFNADPAQAKMVYPATPEHLYISAVAPQISHRLISDQADATACLEVNQVRHVVVT